MRWRQSFPSYTRTILAVLTILTPQTSQTTVLKWGTELLQGMFKSVLLQSSILSSTGSKRVTRFELILYAWEFLFFGMCLYLNRYFLCGTDHRIGSGLWVALSTRNIKKRLHEQIQSQAFSNYAEPITEVWQWCRWELSDSFNRARAQPTMSY